MGDIHHSLREKITKHRKTIRKTWSLIAMIIMVFAVAFSAYKTTDMVIKYNDANATNEANEETIKQLMKKYNHTLENPTTRQLAEFLALDDTDGMNYSSTFNCVGFSAMLVSHAIARGWNCGLVQMWYDYYYLYVGGGHVMVAFNVTNEGIIFVEPQGDEMMPPLKQGDAYLNKTIASISIHWFV